MSARAVRVFPGAYRDSLLLLSATRAMEQGAGVSWASAAMATPATIEDLAGRGFPPGDLAGADANALVLAVCAADGQAADDALGRARAALFAGPAGPAEEHGRPEPRTIGEAVARLPQANVAVVSVPGPYAAMAAHSALTAGLHVLLFSDNVPLAAEMELKRRASRLAGWSWAQERARPYSAGSVSASPTPSGPARSGWWPQPAPVRRKS